MESAGCSDGVKSAASSDAVENAACSDAVESAKNSPVKILKFYELFDWYIVSYPYSSFSSLNLVVDIDVSEYRTLNSAFRGCAEKCSRIVGRTSTPDYLRTRRQPSASV